MSSDATTATSAVNLPIPVLSTFNCDQLTLLLGTCLVDAIFVLERETGNLVAANHRLLDLLGRTADELEGTERSFSRFIHLEDRGIFQTWFKEDLLEGEAVFETRLVDKEGMEQPVEVCLKSIRWKGKEYCLGFVSPCGERHQRESKLRQQVELQKSRALQALKSSLRVYELNEKIKSTLVLTATLLNVENEEQLYEEAVRVLTNAEGLNFRDVTFLVLEGSKLKVVCSTRDSLPEHFSLTEANKYSRCIRKGFPRGTEESSSRGHEVLVPLRSRESLLGIIEVSQYPREKAFFDEYKLLTVWQRDMLVQIGDIIALLLDNLRLKRELKRQTIIDSLTGAYNRNFFMSRLNSECHRATRYGRPVSAIFIDVDFFKQVNDDYGHLQGDDVLRQLGELFLQSIRDVDVVCRFGGDEFVIMLPETDAEEAKATAEKIRHTVREHHFANLDAPSQRIEVTVSLGLSTLKPNQSKEQFLHEADAALYRAKASGRNKGVSHGDDKDPRGPASDR